MISGTWWMGTGTTFDPSATVPAETIFQVWGVGPATSTPAEKR